jgi:hypothetical protein
MLLGSCVVIFYNDGVVTCDRRIGSRTFCGSLDQILSDSDFWKIQFWPHLNVEADSVHDLVDGVASGKKSRKNIIFFCKSQTVQIERLARGPSRGLIVPREPYGGPAAVHINEKKI